MTFKMRCSAHHILHRLEVNHSQLCKTKPLFLANIFQGYSHIFRDMSGIHGANGSCSFSVWPLASLILVGPHSHLTAWYHLGRQDWSDAAQPVQQTTSVKLFLYHMRAQMLPPQNLNYISLSGLDADFFLNSSKF